MDKKFRKFLLLHFEWTIECSHNLENFQILHIMEWQKDFQVGVNLGNKSS